MKVRSGFSRLYYFMFLLLFVIVGGTLGYMSIEGWSLIDSLYMTIITVSTVGFGEVDTLSTSGKLFTASLIIFSLGIFAYAIGAITTYIVGGEYKKYLKEYKMLKQLKQMSNHVIVCGFGRVGKQVAEDLRAMGKEFVILESDEHTAELCENEGFNVLRGDGTDDENLIAASIKDASAVITCLPKDADNLYVVLAAREFRNDAIIVSRASNPAAVSKLKMAGASNVIMPGSVGGSHMASLIAHPDVIEFLDIIRVKGYQGANVESISYDELPKEFRDKTIEELEARRITGATIIGFRPADGEYIINPPLETRVGPGSKLFVLGNTEQIEKFTNYFQLSH